MSSRTHSFRSRVLSFCVLVGSASLLGCAEGAAIDDRTSTTPVGGVGAKAASLAFRPELGLAGYWSFDLESNPGANSSGLSPAAQIKNAAWKSGGRSAGALYFKQRDAVVTIPDGAWNTGNPVTYNLWFKPEGPAVGYLLGHEFTTTSAGAFAVDAAGARFRSYDATRKVRDLSFAPVPANAWTMLSVVIDRTAIRLYKNGTRIGEASRTMVKRSGPLYLGVSSPNTNPFQGWIDEVSVFKRALTDADIAAISAMYDVPSAPQDDGSAGRDALFLARWTFDDGTATDVSGHEHHGEISGATAADAGRFGKALYFDGKSHVRIPGGTWNVGAPITYNAWIKPEGEPYGFVFDNHVGWQDPGSFALMNEAKKQLKFLAYDEAGNEIEVLGDGVPSDAWTMLTAVFKQAEVRLYRNGVLWRVIPKQGLPPSEGDLYLGAADNAKWGFFTGWIDEVSIIGRALSDADVLTLTESPICCQRKPGATVPRAGSFDTFSNTISQAAAVVEGTVKSIDYAYTDEQGPTTLITLLNVKTHLGNAPKELVVRQRGGPLPDGRWYDISHQVQFVKGRGYLLLLRNTAWNLSPLVGANGFRIESVGGRELLIDADGSAISAIGDQGFLRTGPIFEHVQDSGEAPPLISADPDAPRRATSAVQLSMPSEQAVHAVGREQSPEEERQENIAHALSKDVFLSILRHEISVRELQVRGEFFDAPSGDYNWNNVPVRSANKLKTP